MRVIGGALRGRRLLGAGSRGLRPTQDRVRECLFDILGEEVQGARTADLYAGTGSLGIEALSRGAAHVLFAECSSSALSVLERNLTELRLLTRCTIVRERVEEFLELYAGEPFDLVLADPPYGRGMAQDVLEALALRRLLGRGGVVVLERRRSAPELAVPRAIELRLARNCGETRLEFYVWRGEDGPRDAAETHPRQGGEL